MSWKFIYISIVREKERKEQKRRISTILNIFENIIQLDRN